MLTHFSFCHALMPVHVKQGSPVRLCILLTVTSLHQMSSLTNHQSELLLCFAGPAGRATRRRWGHQLTQVFRAAAAGFPGRTGHLPNPDTKLTASSPHRLHPAVTDVNAAPQTASGIHEQPTVSDQLQESHSQAPAHPQLPASQLQQSPACASASLEQPLGQSLYQRQTHGLSSSQHLPPSTSASDQVSQPVNTGKTGGSVPAPQMHASLAAAPLLSVSRQEQDLADAKQQPEGSRSASAVPEVKAHSQALALPLKAEPQLQKVEVTVQAQTDQHASARQALPSTMHLHQQERVVHSPQKPNMLRLQSQPTSVCSAQAPISTPVEVIVQAAAQASQSNAAPASGNQDPDVPHCEAPHAQSPIPHDQEMLEAAVKQTGLELACHMEAANSAVPTVLAECLASNRIKRVPGGDPLEVCLPLACIHCWCIVVFTALVDLCQLALLHAMQQLSSLGLSPSKHSVNHQDFVVICIAWSKGDA